MPSIHSTLRRIYNKTIRPSRIDSLVERGLTVGKRLNIQYDVDIDWSHCWHISIGDDVTLAPRVHILAHDASTKKFLGLTRIGKVKIGDRVFVGASTVILPGVSIGDDVIIGAGSVVSRDVPSGTVAAGNPAKVLCSLEEFLSKRRSEISRVPSFGAEFTDKNEPSSDKKTQMNEAMKERVGYII